MSGQVPVIDKEVPRLDLPDDVAVLYTWAKLEGVRYRDFSADRREARAWARQRMAEAAEEAERRARNESEIAAQQAERAAREAAQAARFHQAQARRAFGENRADELEREEVATAQALRHAGELSRRAALDRAEARRRSQAVEAAQDIVRRRSQELAEAHASSLRQAERYAGHARSGAALALADPPPLSVVPPDPYTRSDAASRGAESAIEDTDMAPERFPQRRDARRMSPGLNPDFGSVARHSISHTADRNLLDTPRLQAGTGASSPGVSAVPRELAAGRSPGESGSVCSREFGAPELAVWRNEGKQEVTRHSDSTSVLSGEHGGLEPSEGGVLPAWIHDGTSLAAPANPTPPSVVDTLQQSRERVASRWYALRGVFDPETPDMEPMQASARATGSTTVAIFSLAGGVGKTSLAASLGRSLSAAGEKVLLADLTPQGILPFYFGATELREAVVRTFSPPPGSADAPVSLVSYDLLRRAQAETGAEEFVLQQLTEARESVRHLLVDLNPAAVPFLRRLTSLDATVLVPVAPDMNTVITLAAMEKLFAELVDNEGRPVQPRYLLTQFDSSLPLHLDVREGLRQKLGARLLPFVIRRSPEVSEALAEGMTVIDYAPASGVAADYKSLGNWVRTMARQPSMQSRGSRWSER